MEVLAKGVSNRDANVLDGARGLQLGVSSG